ncbi:MAG TPA: PIG-L deacetylase family protein [Symbiobacteriaceae bacterium]|nr:PIG-L deacetylase family protein [Symbiobacteriaceae bacterium]
MSRLKSWTLGLGAGLLGAWWAAGRALSPRYPDIALQAGLELVSFPRRVLAISPHPLDLEWFCGGACFLMKRAGGTVTAAVLTRGEAGGNRANMGQIREKEQAQSGAILGYESIAYLGCKDQQLHAADLAPKLEAVWRQIRPDVVLTFDPRGALPGRLSNPDHAAAGAAVLELLRSGIGNSTRVYLYGTRSPNVAVDITEVVQEKEAAVRAHRSQMAGPDAVAKAAVRAYGRLLRGRTPSFYSETFYRLV